MVNRVQSLRSSTAKARPSGQLPGMLYTNWPDRQIGVIDNTGTAMDLVAVRFFSATTSYAIGDVVAQGGALYAANAAVSAGAFNPAQWNKLQTSADTGGYAYLPLAGGSMAGPLVLAADPTANLQATTKQYVDLHSGAVTIAATPPSNPNLGALWWDSVGGQLYVYYNDGNSSQWVISVSAIATASLPLSGGTLTGPLILAADPTAALGAVTKQYSDAKTLGVANGSDAAAGQIGEFLSANVTSPVTLSTGVGTNIASLPLTAGDWDVYGEIWLSVGAGGATGAQAGLNTVSGTVPNASAINTSRWSFNAAMTASTGQAVGLRPCRASLSSPTTYYLNVLVVFPSGTTTAFGNIMARRAR